MRCTKSPSFGGVLPSPRIRALFVFIRVNSWIDVFGCGRRPRYAILEPLSFRRTTMALTIAEVMRAMPAAFVPEKAAGVTAKVQVAFTSDGGGQDAPNIHDGGG